MIIWQVASPTGSGKTSLFELAILGMLKDQAVANVGTGRPSLDHRTRGQRKAIYVAPMRSLVQEKAQEWKERLGRTLGLTVNEFTGEHWSNGVEELERSDIILTTPERFDSITRRSDSCRNSNTSFLSKVHLVMLDEVHLLAESRGPSLEAIVARLKLSQGLAQPPRFMACSATFKNVEDVAQWLGVPPEGMFSFGNEMRPVPLDIKIKTYPSRGNNEYLFSKKLDEYVYPVLTEFSNNKPALCFCTTKAETSRLAKKLSSSYRTTSGQSVFVRDAQHRSLLLEASRRILDDGLKRSIREGVGYHNAELSREDKAIVEELFGQKQLPIVATTSTLAMGMNLPAYLVIIKGVRLYRGNSQYAMLDYSSILQMIGRAGRPQFDVKGVAVIMAEPRDERSLDNILNLSEVVESSLLGCLAECLNAEICNGMVTSVDSAMRWLQTTYLWTRVMKNPSHYGVPREHWMNGPVAIATWLQETVLGGTVTNLIDRGMAITDDRGLSLASTAPGVLMAENYVRLETMSLIVQLGPKATMEDFAWAVSSSVELCESIIVRRNEKKWLNKINSSSLARYTIKDPAKPGSKLKRIQLPCQKAFALMMFDLSSECRAMIKDEATRDSGPVQGLIRDAATVISKGAQICKCIIRYFEATPGMATALCEALVFKKALERRLWPDDPFLVTQTKGIGEKIASRLVKNNIINLRDILRTDARRLEVIAELRPPQGTVMQDNVSSICPAPLRVIITLQERRTTMVASVTLTVARDADSPTAPSQSKSNDQRWCKIIVFNTGSNDVLVNRRARYSAFGREGGMQFQVDTRSHPDASSSVVVRVIDESVLGVDVRAAVPMLPSTEAESRQTLRTESKKYGPDAVLTPTPTIPGNLQLEPPAGSMPNPSNKISTKPSNTPMHQKNGPSPTAVQAKLDFAPKKRPRITEAEVIDLLGDDTDDAVNATGDACTKIADERPGTRPRPHPTGIRGATKRVTSTSDVADFNRSYTAFMEGFDIFLS